VRAGRLIRAFAACLAVLAGGAAGADPGADLVRAVVETGGEATDGVSAATARVEQGLSEIVERLGHAPPGPRLARRLHRLLHRRYLREYVADADDVVALVDTGRYNCLSATLFYGMAARRLGFDPEVLKLPGHLLLRLHVRGRVVDVETTSPFGFNLGYTSSLSPRPDADADEETLSRRLEWPRTSPLYGPSLEPRWQVPLEIAVGYAWLNRAWRDLEAGDAVNAARDAGRAGRTLGGLAAQDESLRRLLARAFRREYEAGRFERAYAVAVEEVGLFPNRTTSRDRLLAATVKRIEDLCDAGTVTVALRLLDEASGLCLSPVDRARLARRAAPLAAAAAVRTAQWELAERAAQIYAAAEPDALEGERLRSWVRDRRRGVEPGDDALLRPRGTPGVD